MDINELPQAVRDKAGHILAPLEGLPLPKPTGYFVLVVQWRQPSVAKIGSILLTETYKDKLQRTDDYQGRTGIVLALGPDAYGDAVKYPSGPWCKPGDFVLWPAAENTANRIKYGRGDAKVVMTLLPDDRVTATELDPEMAEK